MPVLVPARGRSQTRANYCSCNSSWRYGSPRLGTGNPCTMGSCIQRWTCDPHHAEAAHLLPTQVSAPACPPRPPPTSSSCHGEGGGQAAGRRPILFNYVQANSHHEEASQEEMPPKSAESCCTSLERAGGEAKPGLHTSSGLLTPVPCWLHPHLNLWHPFPNRQDVFTVNNRDMGRCVPFLFFKAKHQTLYQPLLSGCRSGPRKAQKPPL